MDTSRNLCEPLLIFCEPPGTFYEQAWICKKAVVARSDAWGEIGKPSQWQGIITQKPDNLKWPSGFVKTEGASSGYTPVASKDLNQVHRTLPGNAALIFRKK